MMLDAGVEIHILEKYHDVGELCDIVQYLSKGAMCTIFNELSFPVTVILEKYYVDRVYRDAYYSYFSNKHFDMPRNCQRLAMFQGAFDYQDFLLGNEKDKHQELQDAFIGTIVIKPTPIVHSNCTMGRTLLNPKKLHLPKCYIRTTKFNVSILGTEYTIEAFPFTGQDGEVMTCAETCIWEILEYFGTRYSNYKTVLPKDIIAKLNSISQERILPSEGLTFLQMSDLLKAFGFEPRLYARKSYENVEQKHLTKSYNNSNLTLFRKFFHYYVESAIPLVVGVGDSVHEEHAVVCIGHGNEDYTLKNIDIKTVGNIKIVDTASFYKDYVIVDDNQIPYRLEQFDHFAKNKNMKVQFLAVPLYKHIFLEVNGAVEIVNNFFEAYSSDIENMLKDMGLLKCNSEPLVMRLFLTASRNFKKFRIKKAETMEERLLYSEMKYPKFIWVCEFSTFFTYTRERKVIGEIVLDATASGEAVFDSIIAIRIGKYNGYREAFENIECLFGRLENYVESYSMKYPLYRNNLRKGGFEG